MSAIDITKTGRIVVGVDGSPSALAALRWAVWQAKLAALFNLRIAAAVAGLEAEVRLLPDPRQPLLMAEVGLARPHGVTSWDRELYAAIFRRQANREPFSNRLVPPGIPDRTLGSRSPVGRSPVRDFDPRHRGTARYAWFEEHPQLAVLSAGHGGPRNWLTAGQVLQRVWLTATCRGISVCPLTQPLESAAAWETRDPLSGSGQPQMILRIGYGLPIPPGAPRRPVADVIDQPQPDQDQPQAQD